MKTTNVLSRVRKHFPNVTKVVDATKPVIISVNKKDSRSGKKKDPKNCALARACVRTKIADGAIINVGNSYLIKGNIATRYHTSVTVAREITSFDRHQDFASGKDYRLSQVSPSARIGAIRSPDKRTRPYLSSAPTPIVHKHRTSRIRVAKVD